MKFYLIIIILFASCAFDEDKNIGDIVKQEVEVGPDQTAHDVQVSFTDSNFTKAILKANRSEIYENEKETWLKGNVEVTFFSRKSGSRVSFLTCDSSLIEDAPNDMFAYGNVHVVADSSGTTLDSQFLEFNEKKSKLYSDQYVKIENPYEILEGIGFESDLDLKNYRIYKVKGVKKKDG